MLLIFQLEGTIGHDCGGAIITKDWVLSTAQCINLDEDINPEQFVVVAGDHDLHKQEGSEQVDFISFNPMHVRSCIISNMFSRSY